jgi:hypothetical protein
MTTREWKDPGRPFPDNDRDPRSPGQLVDDLCSTRRQVAGLVQREQDGAFRRELLRALQQRRHHRRGMFWRKPPLQFDAVRTPGRRETLIVTGELLVRSAVLSDRDVQDFIRRYRFQRSAVSCLDGRVTRLRNPELDPQRLNDIARLLRQRGFSASVNHIAPLGPVGKGLGGPEPSDGRLVFPGEQVGGVQVAVIDTGIAQRRRPDGWLAAVPRGGNIDPLDAFPAPSGDGFLDFGAGHGSFVAGILQQVEGAADIRVIRALDSDGIGSDEQVACAMVQAVQDGARILNLSLGTETLDDQPPTALEVALEIIGELEQQRGEKVVIVAAAGNFASSRPCWPAAFRRVVSVAGLTADLTATSWSNRGFWVDCSAVGEGVLSTYVEGNESFEADPKPDSFPQDPFALWSGTSFAAPQIAGALARICREDQVPPEEALRRLLNRGKPLPDFGRALKILPGT